MKAEVFSETLVIMYQTKRCHEREDHSPYLHSHQPHNKKEEGDSVKNTTLKRNGLNDIHVRLTDVRDSKAHGKEQLCLSGR
jgi:hypothetical protein